MNAVYQNYDHPACFWLYCGVKGCGKTTEWFRVVKREQCRIKFIFDHQDGEFSHRFKIPSVSTPEELDQKTALGGYVIFDYRKMFEGDKPAAFDFFCEYVFAASGALSGRKIFACDELHKLVEQRTVPTGFQKICDEGRRRGVDIYAICHGPNLLHNSIRNEVTKLYTFRQMDETSIKFLTDCGIDPEKIKTLPNGKWICRANTGEITEGGNAFRPKHS